MKKNLLYILIGIWLCAGCDHGFEDMNKNPESVTGDEFNFRYLFTTAQLRTATCGDNGIDNWRSNIYHCELFVQHLSSLIANSGSWQGDKYFYNSSDNAALWNRTFAYSNVHSNAGKLIVDVIENVKGKDEYHNLHQMARIWRVFIFHRLTDLYGDIPYSEACRGYYDQNFTPRYDPQQEIYADMLNELAQAAEAFDNSKPAVGTVDIVFQGDHAKWRRFAYSMMLRLGMRLSKVDAAKAQEWTQKAFQGGVMQSNSDNCFIQMTDRSGANQALINGDSWTLSDKAKADGKLSEVFVDYLKTNNDPRLRYVSAIYENPDDALTPITDPARQKGMPNGYDRAGIAAHPSWDAGSAALEHQYSSINRDVLGQFDGPMMFLTCAEVRLLLAEACVRGWISGDAATYYAEGVTAAMKNLATYQASAVISDAEIAAYLAQAPFVGTSDAEKALEQINTQFWASTLLNGYEAFANWRRSGYPRLTPVNFPGNDTNGVIPRRCKYPESELVYNEISYREAVARQGADSFTTRVWWDKE